MLMRRKRQCITALVTAAIAALALGSAAKAIDASDLSALGYSTSTSFTGGTCPNSEQVAFTLTASGFGVGQENFGSICNADFNTRLAAFVAGHPERKLRYENRPAVEARATVQDKGYSVTTDYSAPAFTVTGDCNVNTTVGPAELVGLAATLPASAPCAPPPADAPAPGSEPPATQTAGPAAPGTVEDRIAALEAQLRALAARVSAIKEANDAAWKALVAAFEAGYPPHLAALAARSAGLNAMYQLG